jgi:hypothetical protein
MKPTFIATLCLVATATLAACAVTTSRQNAPEARSVQSGARDKIAYFYNLTASCQAEGVPQVTVTKTPGNGSVTLATGDNLPQYPADNPRSACNQQPVGSTEVYYQSRPDYHGADGFSIEVRYSSTFTQTYSYNLTVN